MPCEIQQYKNQIRFNHTVKFSKENQIRIKHVVKFSKENQIRIKHVVILVKSSKENRHALKFSQKKN